MGYSLDGHKLLHHLDRLIPWTQGKDIFPLYLAFSPTSACQCACRFCPFHLENDPGPSRYFPWPRFKTLVKELKEAGVKAIFFSGEGEPTLHPNFYDMVACAREEGLAVALNSNLIHLKVEEAERLLRNLSWLRVSLNGENAERYAFWHGTEKKNFSQVMDHLRHLSNVKKNLNLNCTLGVQSLFLNQELSELEEHISKCKKIGLDYFSLKPYLKHPDSQLETPVLPPYEVLEKLENLSTPDFKVYLRQIFSDEGKKNYQHCHSFDFMAELGSDGDLYTCGAMVGNPNFSYGSLLTQSFSDLWVSTKRKEVKSRIFQNHKVDNCMPHCRHHAVNEWLWNYLHAPEHRNFI